MLKKGMEVEVTITGSIFPNIGLGDFENQTIRVKGALVGQRVRVRISRKKKDYLQGKIVEIITRSPLEEESLCPHFGSCGGCSYQNMTYENELIYKEKQVRELFRKHNLEGKIKTIVESPNYRHYRNKMDFTFGDEYKYGPLALGMHKKGRFYEIETVRECNICDRDFTKILEASLEFLREKNYKFYNRRTHIGLLRHFIIRKSFTNGDIMVNLVSSSQGEIDTKNLVNRLLSLELDGKITGILHTINDNVADIVKIDEISILYGRDYIEESICGLNFRISPLSFFQTNTLAAEKLYKIARDYMGDIRDKKVFDLYSGTGTIAQIMAKEAKEVIAIELNSEAVKKARENAKINKLNNIKFIEGDMFKVIDQVKTKPDLVVIDPPRPGLENTLKKLINTKAREIVYISCNPTTFIRDILEFQRNGYEIGEITLLDQFPRTPHVEAVTLLTYSGSKENDKL